MTDHSALIERLEAAEAGSAELDEAVALACGSRTQGWAEWASDGTFLGSIRSYTTSIDAALALAERLGLDGFHTVYAALMNWKAHDPRGPASKTLPLALCIAILKAKAQGEGNG